jgi:hypothetical protein
MAELQTDKFSPFPVETMAIGAEVLDASETSSLVAMAAVRREKVDEVGRPFQEAGAPPDVVDVAALGWWWGLKHAGHVPSHGSQLFLRTADAGLEMAVARDGMPLLFRLLPKPPPDELPGALDEWIAECTEEMSYSLTSLETEWGDAGLLTMHVFAPGSQAGWAEPLHKALRLDALFIARAGVPADGVRRHRAPAGGTPPAAGDGSGAG